MSKAGLVMIMIMMLASSLSAQTETVRKKYTISGHVKDSKTGEAMIGATIMLNELPQTGTISNAYGFFSLTIPEGTYTVTVRFMGYTPFSRLISMNRNARIDIELEEKGVEQKAVVVTGEKKDENIKEIQMGMEKLDVKSIQDIPVLFGEKDVIKTVQLLPGVKSGGDGNTGFYVRGGAADQNLILLDEANVYSASHFLGFFSVFNSDAIKDVTLYKGEMPSEYGGRLSSVLDIKMKDGNTKDFGVNGGIGLIASRLSVEGPIVSDKGSFSISGRRTYLDLFLKLSSDSSVNRVRLYFYDLNAKANYQLGENDRIYLSGYFGKDVLGFGNTFGIDWGNTTATFRWNHLFNEKIFSNTSLIYSTYDYTVIANLNGNNLNLISKIKDEGVKQDFQYFFDSENGVKFGLNSIYHAIVPGTATFADSARTSTLELTNKYSWENAFYVSHDYKLSPIISVQYGVRFSFFSVLGPGVFYTYDSKGDRVDSLAYGSGKFIKTYFNLEPRIALNYILDDEGSLKASYGRTTQNLHLLSTSTTSNPTDIWIPNSNNVQPEIADQVSLGYFRNFEDNSYEFSAETYYKLLRNQIDYKDGAQIGVNENVESQLLFGSGRAYGLELFLKKKYGRLNGWIGYTLSRTELKFAEINNGNYYPAHQDRTHDISIVGIYQLSDKWTFSATWVYYTGNAVTFPSGKYRVVEYDEVNYFTERNGYRMPAYHRLDLGATWQGERSSWTFSLYNAYGRENAYSIRFQKDPNDPAKTQAVQTALFKFVPSITYNFRF
jgi:TonB dependent receptor/CarboxypepD_reg-like domain/TonB-dependent Receptor Plug Domain